MGFDQAAATVEAELGKTPDIRHARGAPALEQQSKIVADARALPLDIAKAIRAGRQDVADGSKLFLEDQETAQTAAKKAAYYHGILSSKQLAAGLKDSRPELRAEAEAVRAAALAALEKLGVNAYDIAVDAGVNIDEGLWGGYAAAGKKSGVAAARVDVVRQLRLSAADASYWGGHIIDELIAGMKSRYGACTRRRPSPGPPRLVLRPTSVTRTSTYTLTARTRSPAKPLSYRPSSPASAISRTGR
jgi:hypothetical protein